MLPDSDSLIHGHVNLTKELQNSQHNMNLYEEWTIAYNFTRKHTVCLFKFCLTNANSQDCNLGLGNLYGKCVFNLTLESCFGRLGYHNISAHR